MDRPYVSEKMARKIEGFARRGEATALLLGPSVWLQLHRRNEATGEEQALQPVLVRVDYPNAQASEARGAAGGQTNVVGFFVRFWPWDVEPGDVGRLGDGSVVRITFVESPAHGIVRARFTQAVG